MTSNVEIDSNLINQFRNEVNKGRIIYSKLKNVGGKNKWNVLCSAMDWIDVATSGIPTIELNPKGFGVSHKETINLMQYIILIDVLYESIIQMYRVLGIEKEYPLENCKKIFNQSKISDDLYFKHIRAVFSTHPVNLTSLDGDKDNKPNKHERFFASYVARNGLNDEGPPDDYYVSLYSNNPENDITRFFGIRMDQINEYLETRYSLLADLIDKVKSIKSQHLEEGLKKNIPSAENPIEQLDILLKENELRFDIGYGYTSEINYLRYLLSLEIDEYDFDDFYKNIIKDYQDFLTPGVNKIKEGLEKMDASNFIFEDYSTGYEFAKIYDYLETGNNPVGQSYFEELISQGVLPESLWEETDLRLYTIVLDALLYHLINKTGKEDIDLNEIIDLA